MKSVIEKRKVIPLLVFVLFGLLNIFNLSSGIAIYMQGEGATFHPNDDYPTQYGVFIPSPNMYTTMSIQGSNQGEFVMMNWLGGAIDTETVNYPGDDISMLYPWYFDSYVKGTPTSNGYIDPWDVNWMNITALNPHNVSLSPYTMNSLFNFYVMSESTKLQIPLNHSIPMQIDITISNLGPHILKYDWLTDDPSNIGQSIDLISPSGKEVDFYKETATTHAIVPPTNLFDYLTFVAHEKGTYRLLIYAWHISDKPAYLTLEFLSTSTSSFPLETLIFEGNGDEVLTIEEAEHSTWRSNWLSINGEKGDIFRLELNPDYATGEEPIIKVWSPCDNGYILFPSITQGTHEIYFPSNGKAYISFIDAGYGDWYRYGLYLSKYEALNYNIGSNLTSIKISRDQSKVIEFLLEDDGFVRFNYTSTPPGNPYLAALGTLNSFIFMDSKSLGSYEILSPIETKIVDTESFYYYYMTSGTYKAVIRNTDESYDAVFEINSKFVEFTNNSIPINFLTYPDTSPSQFTTIEFEPDEYYSRLKEGIGIGINITEPGQYRLNMTMNLSDYMEVVPPSIDPSAVVYYNFSSDEYNDYTSNATTQYQSFPIFTNIGDSLFLASTTKFQEMIFNFSQLGVNPGGAPDLFPYVWHDSSWYSIGTLIDNTNEFEINGSWIIDNSDPDYINWEKGSDFDLPNIIEDDFYWLEIYCDDDFDGGGETLPYIDLINLNFSGVSLEGEMNFALVRESGFSYSDYWELTAPNSISLIYPQRIENHTFSDEQWLFGASSDPYILGLEEGYYKLLIIPNGWSYEGPIEIQFGIENYWDYNVGRTFIINDEPLAYPWQIGNLVNVSDPILYNYSTYPYDFTIAFNDTIVSWDDYTGYFEGYIVLNCFGTAYSWTQLVVEVSNITDYELYLMQELPWIDGNGPNMEIATIDTSIGANNTIEFGVIRDNFTLLFEYHGDGNENIEFNIGLRQYNTTALYSNEITASYTPQSNGDILVLTLAIVIPTVAGAAVVVVYVLKKKGRILTKTP